jgi:hypothetical protein
MTALRAIITAAREANEAEIATILAAQAAPALAEAKPAEGEKPAGEPDAATQAAAAAAAAPAEGASEKGVRFEFKGIGTTDDGVIIGIGGSVNLDSDNDVIEQSSFTKAVHGFCAATDRKFKGNHKDDIKADLVSIFAGAPIVSKGGVLRTLAKGEALPDPAVEPVVGLNFEKGKETHAFLGVRPHDAALVEEAKKGGVTFSWAGPAKRTVA